MKIFKIDVIEQVFPYLLDEILTIIIACYYQEKSKGMK